MCNGEPWWEPMPSGIWESPAPLFASPFLSVRVGKKTLAFKTMYKMKQ